MILSDIELSKKLERTEARANSDFVETRARLDPASGAEWIEVGGAYAMFDGVGSPLTQTFGLGVFEELTRSHLDELEEFFKTRGSEVFHEISPMADQGILTLLSERGYMPIELTSVLVQSLDPSAGPRNQRNPEISTRLVAKDESDLWASVAAEGWATIHPDLFNFMKAIGTVAVQTSGGHPFLAELDGRPIATGGFSIYDDVCILAGAATIPSARRQGAQNALLTARLNYAESLGCTLAMMCALPGSQSQKNAQRNGFEIAYTRIKWQLKT